MRGCEVVWDVETADRVEELVEESTGEPCPCRQGKTCPFVPSGAGRSLAALSWPVGGSPEARRLRAV